jgi:hypothetical protein
MQDASEECMKECKERFATLSQSMKPSLGESNTQTSERKKAFLIAELIDRGCADEIARGRLVATPIAGLIGELCGCECSGYFPYKDSSSESQPGSLESVHPPPNGSTPP